MKSIGAVLLLAALTVGAGCAKSDWIERTLVTVDVTGTWSGRVGGAKGTLGTPIGTLWVDLEQKGATVKGLLQYEGGAVPRFSTPVDGNLTGDVLRFKLQTAGLGAGEGELTVTGDEMSGQVWLFGGLRPISLQRADPSTRPPR
jgi:hypothetical protein